MKKNMGIVDRVIRLLVAALLITLYLTEIVTGTVGILLSVFAFIFTITSFVSFCPLYVLFGINTCGVKNK